jgi:two-component system sensor histidine kinase GlrK
MLRLPFSFRTLLVWAFLLVALLPSLALMQMWWHLDHLSIEAEMRLADIDRWQGGLRTLAEREDHLERSSRQWLLLKDPALRQLALGFANDMQSAAHQLDQVPDASFRHVLADERGKLAQITAWLNVENDEVSQAEIGAVFDGMSSNHVQMERALRNQMQIERRVWAERLRTQREQADHMALFSVSLALALAWLLGYLLFAPLGRLRQRIGKLAQGVRGQSWQVAGPTDVRRLAQALQGLDARLEQLEAEKASFFRQVSHELKTPLAAISEASALLADEVAGPLSDGQREIVAIQQSNVNTLRARVETLLRHDVARWLNQQVVFQPFSLSALIGQRQHDWHALLARRGLQLESRLEADEVLGDVQKVQTIIENLLINAIRHSPNGGRIVLSALRERRVIRLRVQDEGPGVSAEHAARIFDPFFSGPAPAGENPGSGIGLTMARTFAQLMGGDVQLISGKTRGGCFELFWPEDGKKT